MTGAGGVQVAVVGAGPAGSSLALRLSRRGARVALLDAATFPRSKPCGDCLSPGATPLLEELGVRPAVERAGAGELSGWRMRTPSGRWFGGRFGAAPAAAGGGPARSPAGDARTRPPGRPAVAAPSRPPGPRTAGEAPDAGRAPADSRASRPGDRGGEGGPTTGYALPRRDLDTLLVEAAAAAGADLREGARVYGLIRRGGRVAGVTARDARGRTVTLEADVVVGADGLRSAVARRLSGVETGPRPRLALVGRLRGVEPAAAPGASPGEPDREPPAAPAGEMRLGPDGCLGLAPLGGGRWNATLVVPRERAAEISRDRRRFFSERLAAYGVRRRFRDAELLAPLEITGPFRMRPRRLTAPGVLLTGDAAGYFDPLTGQGIYRALATGRAAARAVSELLAAPGPRRRDAVRRRYRNRIREIVAPGRALQRIVDVICRNGPLIEAAGRLLSARTRLGDLFVDVTGDRLEPTALLDPRRLADALLDGPGPERAGGRGRLDARTPAPDRDR